MGGLGRLSTTKSSPHRHGEEERFVGPVAVLIRLGGGKGEEIARAAGNDLEFRVVAAFGEDFLAEPAFLADDVVGLEHGAEGDDGPGLVPLAAIGLAEIVVEADEFGQRGGAELEHVELVADEGLVDAEAPVLRAEGKVEELDLDLFAFAAGQGEVFRREEGRGLGDEVDAVGLEQRGEGQAVVGVDGVSGGLVADGGIGHLLVLRAEAVGANDGRGLVRHRVRG